MEPAEEIPQPVALTFFDPLARAQRQDRKTLFAAQTIMAAPGSGAPSRRGTSAAVLSLYFLRDPAPTRPPPRHCLPWPFIPSTSSP
jgi:hypothetical protein